MKSEINSRYNLRQNLNGLWTVYDIFTGEPAAVNGIVLDMLEMEDAGEWVAQLNLEDRRRRMGPLH
ncbi:hypothetical protein [Rhizobium sp. Root1204]|uniref:hypothetical protein n=1 Tax=Rhizobium sp. Root1204 TaxID=1736428 RepID=UPI000713BB6D|nr:hypothetical protein [Rhizobium sp. Root1204]KQV32894.1 hypothetical protein ASC96_30835 [Rhizobium sp. Root1204]